MAYEIITRITNFAYVYGALPQYLYKYIEFVKNKVLPRRVTKKWGCSKNWEKKFTY